MKAQIIPLKHLSDEFKHKVFNFPRQALHAKTLGFIHPKTKEKLSFDTEVPDDMTSVIDKWRLYSKHKNL